MFILIALLGFPDRGRDGLGVRRHSRRREAATPSSSGSKRLFAAAALLIVLGAGLVLLRPAIFPQGRRGHAGGAAQFDRRAALREPERQSRRRLLLRRHDRRAAERPRQGAATQGRGTHLGVRVQGQGRRRARDRPQARRHDTSSRAACVATDEQCASPRSSCGSPTVSTSGRRPTTASSRASSRSRTRSRDASATRSSSRSVLPRQCAARAPIDPSAYDEYLKGRALSASATTCQPRSRISRPRSRRHRNLPRVGRHSRWPRR